ncbi:hypothetical protein SLA2020_300500 [Shorea laevis]
MLRRRSSKKYVKLHKCQLQQDHDEPFLAPEAATYDGSEENSHHGKPMEKKLSQAIQRLIIARDVLQSRRQTPPTSAATNFRGDQNAEGRSSSRSDHPLDETMFNEVTSKEKV